MKKLLLLLLLLIFPFFVGAQDTGWLIENFKSDITIMGNGTVAITETIEVDFKNLQKHGIYREIPLRYENNKTDKDEILNITVTGVTNGSGDPIKNDIITSRKNLRIKIGDPDVTISGLQKYVIKYEVQGALRNYGSYDELFWNVAGSNWSVAGS